MVPKTLDGPKPLPSNFSSAQLTTSLNPPVQSLHSATIQAWSKGGAMDDIAMQKSTRCSNVSIPASLTPLASYKGKYGLPALILPRVDIHSQLQQFVVDASAPPTPTELCLRREGIYPRAAAKVIDDFGVSLTVPESRRTEAACKDDFVLQALYGSNV